MITPTYSSKLPHVGTTIFTVMSQLAAEHQAINLSQGFPDYEPDSRLLEYAQQAMADGFNQYAYMPGIPALREQISYWFGDKYGRTPEVGSEITITTGATEALYCAIAATIQPGDEVVVFTPAYDSYLPAIQLNGGVPICIPLTFPDYRIDWQQVRDRISSRTRLIMVNFPHNPTGAILTDEDLAELKALALETGIRIISDEVYEQLVFDGIPHRSLAGIPELQDQVMAIGSFGKSLHATGWKVGYAIAPADWTTELRKVHQFVTFSTSHPFQVAIAKFLELHRSEVDGLGDFFQAKRDHFLREMEGSRFEPLTCQGTYFQLMSYRQISELPEADFSQWLTKEHGVACIPVSVFYDQPEEHQVVRFCFAKQHETLSAAAQRLKQI
ncbi:methionine aminotransferase [Pontibacter sp. G13]|uniref:methionine aminotransferase n=1 Tax=Pontibacter sp. G13 TaxID=3074898 RepID=UPI00288952AE|nr:methionine aminotransferase [Pontibacter sp. G13]WNJ16904.1 methionine aminotransferase [Pontibacter sp. G13]